MHRQSGSVSSRMSSHFVWKFDGSSSRLGSGRSQRSGSQSGQSWTPATYLRCVQATSGCCRLSLAQTFSFFQSFIESSRDFLSSSSLSVLMRLDSRVVGDMMGEDTAAVVVDLAGDNGAAVMEGEDFTAAVVEGEDFTAAVVKEEDIIAVVVEGASRSVLSSSSLSSLPAMSAR